MKFSGGRSPDTRPIYCWNDLAVGAKHYNRIVVPAISTALEKRESENYAEFACQRCEPLSESAPDWFGEIAP